MTFCQANAPAAHIPHYSAAPSSDLSHHNPGHASPPADHTPSPGSASLSADPMPHAFASLSAVSMPDSSAVPSANSCLTTLRRPLPTIRSLRRVTFGQPHPPQLGFLGTPRIEVPCQEVNHTTSHPLATPQHLAPRCSTRTTQRPLQVAHCQLLTASPSLPTVAPPLRVTLPSPQGIRPPVVLCQRGSQLVSLGSMSLFPPRPHTRLPAPCPPSPTTQPVAPSPTADPMTHVSVSPFFDHPTNNSAPPAPSSFLRPRHCQRIIVLLSLLPISRVPGLPHSNRDLF